jgi:hypothetical protein
MTDSSLPSGPAGLHTSSSTNKQLSRVDLDPADIQRDLARLVLTLIEFLRRLLEMQAVRRMEAGTITDLQAEALGTTLLNAQDAIVAMCARLDVAPDSLNLDLGPLGRLM